MDATDAAVREELERRLAVNEAEERVEPRPPLPRGDMIALALIVVLSVVVGLIAGVV